MTASWGAGAALALVVGCGPAATQMPPPSPPVEEAAGAGAVPSSGRYHSHRFDVDITVPDGRAWRADDKSTPDLVMVHGPTQAKLALRMVQTPDLVNRDGCEAKVWVAIEPGETDSEPMAGYVFAFGADKRRCLLLRYETHVATGRDDQDLAGQLATARAKIVESIKVGGIGDIGRERPLLPKR